MTEAATRAVEQIAAEPGGMAFLARFASEPLASPEQVAQTRAAVARLIGPLEERGRTAEAARLRAFLATLPGLAEPAREASPPLARRLGRIVGRLVGR